MKRILFGVGTVLLIGIIANFFRLQFFVPITDLTEEQIMKEIEAIYDYSDVREVQDIIYVNERNVFVPVVFDNGNYGISTWKWMPSKKWEVMSLDSLGGPKIWGIEEDTERFFIWNMPPDEDVAGINFYMIRDRNAWISDGIPVYIPRIQLEQHVLLDEERYGYLKMPQEWMELTEQLSKHEGGRKNRLFQSMFSQDEFVQYGWRTVDHNGRLKFIEWDGATGGHGYSRVSDIMFLPLHEGEVESGK